jgi:hypothetical protein
VRLSAADDPADASGTAGPDTAPASDTAAAPDTAPTSAHRLP